MQFLMVDGAGDPNLSQAYQDAVAALFSLSYTLKFMAKKAAPGIDYGVMPLEGLWWTVDRAAFSPERKDLWQWTALIMQPDFISAAMVDRARVELQRRKDLPALADVRFGPLAEGTAAQILHIGPYAAEQPTIAKLHQYINDNGYQPSGKHHEIYLSDPRKAAPEKLKTIIRQPIVKK